MPTIYELHGTYVAAADAPELEGVRRKRARVRNACAAGEIAGGVQIGGPRGVWLIPVDALLAWAAAQRRGRPRKQPVSG